MVYVLCPAVLFNGKVVAFSRGPRFDSLLYRGIFSSGKLFQDMYGLEISVFHCTLSMFYLRKRPLDPADQRSGEAPQLCTFSYILFIETPKNTDAALTCGIKGELKKKNKLLIAVHEYLLFILQET